MGTADFDRECIELVLAEARKCRSDPGRVSVKTAAAAALDGVILATAFRGEVAEGEHAEYTLLERKLGSESLRGATVYTVMEPCTVRQHPKVTCATRLVERRVARVVVGMLDPNPVVTGRGQMALTLSG
jgi:pyrimidine deaminase RibD-like protein